MKKFVELIQRVYRENYSAVINKIATEKIPMAYLSLSSFQDAASFIEELRAKGLTVTHLITLSPPPSEMASELDFQVVTLDKISTIQPRPEYIFTTNSLEARLAISRAPNSKVLYPSGRDTDEIYNIFMNNLTQLQSVYESLIDEQSRRTFRGYWLSSISNQLGEVVYANTSHYLTEGFIPQPGAVVIDGGTFDGKTADFFSDMNCKVYGFEMDKKNFEVAKKLADEKGFTVENFGLGSFRHKITYTSNGSMSQFDSNGQETADIITLDSYVREKKIQRVDFIKLDVEGAEMEVLNGAISTIVRFKPILALSAYHKWDDFWTLMNFVKSIRPDYEFAMRQYTTTFDDDPAQFANGLDETLFWLGLDVKVYWYNECVLFAR